MGEDCALDRSAAYVLFYVRDDKIPESWRKSSVAEQRRDLQGSSEVGDSSPLQDDKEEEPSSREDAEAEGSFVDV